MENRYGPRVIPEYYGGYPPCQGTRSTGRRRSTSRFPIPGTRSRSSALPYGPRAPRSATIRAASAGPIPGRQSSWAAVAVLTRDGAGAARRGRRCPRRAPFPRPHRGRAAGASTTALATPEKVAGGSQRGEHRRTDARHPPQAFQPAEGAAGLALRHDAACQLPAHPRQPVELRRVRPVHVHPFPRLQRLGQGGRPVAKAPPAWRGHRPAARARRPPSRAAPAAGGRRAPPLR